METTESENKDVGNDVDIETNCQKFSYHRMETETEITNPQQNKYQINDLPFFFNWVERMVEFNS